MDNNENTRPVCSCCGATIETDDYYTFEGNILCDDCYHSETVTCEHCGDRIWADDNAGTDSTPLCNLCYDDYYTTLGSSCSRVRRALNIPCFCATSSENLHILFRIFFLFTCSHMRRLTSFSL